MRKSDLSVTMHAMIATDDSSANWHKRELQAKFAPVLRAPVWFLCVLAPALAVAIVLVQAALDLSRAQAQPAYTLAQAPLPPSRPAHLDQRKTSQPEPETAAAPVTPIPRAAARAPAGQSPRAPAPAAAPFHPMTEPGPMTHRRAAVRACTEEWHKLKKTGAAGTRTWRDFSMECLTRKN